MRSRKENGLKQTKITMRILWLPIQCYVSYSFLFWSNIFKTIWYPVSKQSTKIYVLSFKKNMFICNIFSRPQQMWYSDSLFSIESILNVKVSTDWRRAFSWLYYLLDHFFFLSFALISMFRCHRSSLTFLGVSFHILVIHLGQVISYDSKKANPSSSQGFCVN